MHYLDTPEGVLLSNWYVLLMLGLLVALPVRVLPPGEPPATRLAETLRTNYRGTR
jgi:hypothetical protein